MCCKYLHQKQQYDDKIIYSFIENKYKLRYSSYLFKMGQLEVLLSNFCPSNSIKSFAVCLHKPVKKRPLE